MGISPPSRFVLLIGVQNLCLLSPLQANFIEDIILLFSDLIYLFQSYRNGDDFKMSKNRTERLQLRLSSEEKEAIAQKAADANMSISDYIVALSEGKKVIDIRKIAQLILEVRRIGVNVNQIAAVANYNKYTNQPMLTKVNEDQKKVYDLLLKILEELQSTETHSIHGIENRLDKLTEAVERLSENGNG